MARHVPKTATISFFCRIRSRPLELHTLRKPHANSPASWKPSKNLQRQMEREHARFCLHRLKVPVQALEPCSLRASRACLVAFVLIYLICAHSRTYACRSCPVGLNEFIKSSFSSS